MTVITGLEEVIQGGWQLVCMGTDCLEAVSLVNGVGECFADEGVLVKRVRMLLSKIGSPPRGVLFMVRIRVGSDWIMDVIVNGPVTGSGDGK
ncbi:hypothetical protein ACLB2K_072192 [Fragaria x ananassa]